MRVLLLYVHEFSGHHEAALALEKALRELDPRGERRLVDALRYAHPLLERLLQKTYLRIVQKRPEVWGYLYDNPRILKTTESLRRAIHRSHSHKFRDLLESFRPDAIVCTQAFPCGIVSDYKSTYDTRVPLYGVLTDYLPHSYWVLESVDRYFVPSWEAGARLSENGIFEDRISVTGIPIDSAFAAAASKPASPPVVLVMGGGQGIGPIEKIVASLDRLREDFRMTVIAGKNKGLYRKLVRLRKRFRKKMEVFAHIGHVADVMGVSTLLVSKPGGLTIAQALACRLPIIFINPIPGQEAMNASFLLGHKAAVEARTDKEAALFVGQLLRSPAKRELMKKNMEPLAYPRAASDIAKAVLKGIENP